MSTGNQSRTRLDRVARIELPPGRMEQVVQMVRRSDVLLRISMCLAAAVVMWLVTRSWAPPFAYRVGQTPIRNIDARVEFSRPNDEGTKEAKQAARRSIECVYDHDFRKVRDLRAALKDDVLSILHAESFEKADKSIWNRFTGNRNSDGDTAARDDEPAQSNDVSENPSFPDAARQQFNQFREALSKDAELNEFDLALERAMADIDRFGLFESIFHRPEQGRMTEICVRRDGEIIQRVPVEDVRLVEARGGLLTKLRQESLLKPIANELATWISPRLEPTLTFNAAATAEAADRAASEVKDVLFTYPVGTAIVDGGKPLTQDAVEILRLEHDAYLRSLKSTERTIYGLASFGMYIAIFTLCGFYIYVRRKRMLTVYPSLAKLLLLVVVTVTITSFVARYWQSELIPMLLFATTAVIVYRHELALLLAAAVSLIVVLTLGYQISEFVVLSASLASTILLLRHVRSRTKIIYVGVCTSIVAGLTTIGVGILDVGVIDTHLFQLAAWNGFGAILAGVLMTGLLPFIERLFKVQTELSLLELGDVAHPLLQELVRRAPGTYNHSINVASIAEAAADAVGANGLLVRVGAYFHDIGKMLKPGYFVENQGEAGSRHEKLVPAMSTLIIIAHVKDGADLARQHNLPQPIVDFILQHHGTTLVEFFYNRASQQSEHDPNHSSVDEGSYRYPGPKPQTKEAAVLMVSDAVEGAARALVDPTPARIESLVHDLAMKRLLDGQFDDCGLTLKELHVIEDTLVKSLVAMYHGRVQYPDQQSA